MAHNYRVGPGDFASDVNFRRQLAAAGWRGTYQLPPERRLDNRDVAAFVQNLRQGSIPDWQRDDARQIVQMMQSSPRTFSQDHSMRMISQLARNVENGYSRPAQGWQARHYGTFDHCPPYRRAELRELAQLARDNEHSQRRAMNVGLGLMALGGLAHVLKGLG